ncbi:hypothetical protein TRIUR3_01352 [Triticum urartu]|uniref:Uncharacterized protein n=1 Tax=Triticum urartu TaxID=4572 RepID=M7ZR81_TRIUA|nr:hypothetical protein TRIUR3_01352 [Triticum urartu]
MALRLGPLPGARPRSSALRRNFPRLVPTPAQDDTACAAWRLERTSVAAPEHSWSASRKRRDARRPPAWPLADTATPVASGPQPRPQRLRRQCAIARQCLLPTMAVSLVLPDAKAASRNSQRRAATPGVGGPRPWASRRGAF